MVSPHIVQSLLQDETHSLIQKQLCVLRLGTANPLGIQLQQYGQESPKDKKQTLKDVWIIDFLGVWKVEIVIADLCSASQKPWNCWLKQLHQLSARSPQLWLEFPTWNGHSRLEQQCQSHC